MRSHPKLPKDIRASGHRIDFSENRFGDEQGELTGAPSVVDAAGDGLRARESAPQENLGIKNDFERGQRAPPRR